MANMRSSKAAVNEAAAREQAGREGYRFIELRMRSKEIDGAQGFEVMRTASHIDHITGATSYRFDVSGGPLCFAYDASRNGYFHPLVDTPHNRNVLRGVLESGKVEIVDKAVEAEVLSGEAPKQPEVLSVTPWESGMSKGEYFAALNADRAAKGLPPIGRDAAFDMKPMEGQETVGGGEAVDTPVITPSAPVPPAVPNTTTGRGRPAAKGAAPVGSPLVQITEE